MKHHIVYSLLLMSNLVACNTSPAQEANGPLEPVHLDGTPTRVERLGDVVTAIPGQKLNGANGELTPPDDSDRAFAKRLDPTIGDRGMKYLAKYRPQQEGFSLSAARKLGKFILLCYTWKGEDGDAFLVYSLESDKIIGPFCWYIQG